MTTGAPLPVKPRETTVSDLYRGGDLANVIEHVDAERVTGQMVVNLSQGKPTNIEVRRKVPNDLTSV